MHFNVGLQWELSGNQVVYFGDDILILIMGNRKFGNELVRIRENLLDLSLKVYYFECQIIIKISKVVNLLLCGYNIFKEKI